MKFGLALFISSIILTHNVNSQSNAFLKTQKWEEIKQSGSGDIIFYWFYAEPFIYLQNDKLVGIEYAICNGLVKFIESKYNVKLKVKWVRSDQFGDIINNISKSEGGVFGMSGISITEKRNEIVQFTPPYLPDVSFIITSPNVPVETTRDQFIETLNGLTALTVKGSVFEQQIRDIKKKNDLSFDIKSIETTSDLIKALEVTDNQFGYIDIPSFLTYLDKGTTVRRQYFYPIKLPGLSLVFPKNSDWNGPVEAYFNSDQFQQDKIEIMEEYLGLNILELMDQMAYTSEFGLVEEIRILTKESELQYQELLRQNQKLQNEQRIKNQMIIVIILVLVVASIIYTRYRVKLHANQLLALKQEEIEAKNTRLTELNNEKDHLIGVLAHDLRAPISRVIGLIEIVRLESTQLDKRLFDQIIGEYEKMKQLITKILDVEAIENRSHNLNIESITLSSLIEELISEYQEIASKKNIKLQVKINDTELKILGDKVYMHQVLENLLSNAIKFSNQDTTVIIEVDDTGTISICDQGPGFTEDDKLKIFKKFQILSAKPTGGEQSIGLGLVAVKMLVELMNGTITYDSNQSTGTTFYVQMPMA